MEEKVLARFPNCRYLCSVTAARSGYLSRWHVKLVTTGDPYRRGGPVALTQSRSLSLSIEQIETAKAVCRACDVQRDCLDYALTTNQDSGIWGGTSEEERRAIRRQ